MDQFDLTPMEPLPWPDAFDQPDWLYQVKWDGVRMLMVTGSSARLINRRGHERTLQYPELLNVAGTLASDTVLDGEVVALVNGKPSFPRVLQRDFASQPSAIKSKQQTIPVNYLVFDLLYHRGRDLRQLPLCERQALLGQVLGQQAGVLQLVESFPAGVALFDVVKQQGLEGIVAKQRSSRYLPGKRSTAWRKIKQSHTIWCVVGGYTKQQGQLSALLLGLWNDEQQLTYVGAVGSGLSTSDWQSLLPWLTAAETAVAPFALPPTRSQRSVHWLLPKLAVAVNFMEWTPSLKLRAPVATGFQTTDAVDCSFSGQGV